MGRFLIIGNGFDLAHGLPTKYMDFLYACSKLCERSFDYNVEENSVLDLVSKKFYERYKNEDDIKAKINSNSWLQYFFNVSTTNNENKNWIDFEREIREVCNASIKRMIENKFSVFCDRKNNFDLNKMKIDLNELINLLNYYLLVVSEINITYYSKEIVDFMPTDVLSFNYTNTFNKKYNKVLKIDYIHGSINISENTVVLGFDGLENEKNEPEYAEFLKYFQMVNKGIEINSYSKLQETDDNVSMFFGHSLDKTDTDIIKNVILHSKKVYICYHSNEVKSSMIKNLIEIFGRDQFIEYTLSHKKRIYFVQQSTIKIDNTRWVDDFYEIVSNSMNKEVYDRFFSITKYKEYNLGIMPIMCLLEKIVKNRDYQINYLSIKNNYDCLMNIIKEKINYDDGYGLEKSQLEENYSSLRNEFEELEKIYNYIDRSVAAELDKIIGIE